MCVCACEFVVMHFIYLFVYFPPQRSLFFIPFRDRERERKEGRERNFSVREKHWWVASRQHPDRGVNPKLLVTGQRSNHLSHTGHSCALPSHGQAHAPATAIRIPRSPIACGLVLFPFYNIHLTPPTASPVPQPCSHPLVHLSNSVI